MTLTEIVELMSEEIGAEPQLVWGFVRSFIDVISREIDRGNDVKVQGLGTFQWVDVPEKAVPEPGKSVKTVVFPARKKLKFKPSRKFNRRTTMSEEEGMTKLGVVLDDEKDKTASQGSTRICPVCGEELDDAGACPKHGTEPLEPSGQ